ncbi:hypothetical protein B0H10DRAFT_2192666 [Mycena sp. CBHHK59/15]|nr:hypothetical protein B0H10DRAFT_2192666 [Mycena sp. CBHHK59/15]
MTAVSIIHRLHALIRAPLSLQLYRSELPPDVKQAVYNYFLLQSGPNGSRIWEAFLREYTQPEGPTGAVLLQGHLHVWGLLQDHHSRWILSVDVPHTPRFHN